MSEKESQTAEAPEKVTETTEAPAKTTEKKAPGKKAGKKTKAKVAVVKRDTSLRPVMMSRTTAMFTIPPEVRDKARLIPCHNKDHRARITWHPDSDYRDDQYPPKGEIRIRLTGKGEPSPEEMS